MNHNETNGNQHFDLVKTEQNQGNLLKGIDKKTGGEGIKPINQVSTCSLVSNTLFVRRQNG